MLDSHHPGPPARVEGRVQAAAPDTGSAGCAGEFTKSMFLSNTPSLLLIFGRPKRPKRTRRIKREPKGSPRGSKMEHKGAQWDPKAPSTQTPSNEFKCHDIQHGKILNPTPTPILPTESPSTLRRWWRWAYILFMDQVDGAWSG